MLKSSWKKGMLVGWLVLLCVLVGCKKEHIHEFGQWETVTQPDCVTEGLQERSCACGVKENQVIAALGHREVVDQAVAATCTESGLTEGKHCSVCNEVLVNQRWISVLGHDFGAYVSNNDATCTSNGSETATCKRCGETHTQTELGSVLGHLFVNYISNHDATCTDDGTETSKCSRCDATHTRTELGSVLGHLFENYAFNHDATCTTDGTETSKCSRCDVTHTRTELGSVLGHLFENYAFNHDATCTTDGTETSKCSRCDVTHTRTELGSVLGHLFENYAFNHDATCTTDGTETSKCSRCDVTHTRTELGSVLGHLFENYAFNHDATCTADGTETSKCSRCDATHTRTELGSVLGHLFEDYISNNDATCTADGTHTSKCSRCDVYNTCREIGSVRGHNYEDGLCKACGTEKLPTSTGLEYALNADGKGYSVVGIGTCTDTQIVIPRMHNGLPVTAIGDSAFAECDSLISVKIQKGITSIGDGAFQRCFQMTSVILPDGLLTIGASAFEACGKLQSIQIPESLKKIGDGAFYYCIDLQRVDIRDIKSWCNIEFANVGANPLSNAYLYLDGEQVTVLTIPQGVRSVGNYAFSGCLGLRSVIIPNAETIGKLAFSWCFDLTGVTLGEGVQTIDQGAFQGCSKLSRIEVPASLTAIGDDAMRWCEGLGKILFAGTQQQWTAIAKGTEWDGKTGDYSITYVGETGAPVLELIKADITLSPAYGTSYDLYALLKEKENFDQSRLICISADETAVRIEGTKVVAMGNTTGVQVTMIYGDQSVTCLVRVTGLTEITDQTDTQS